MASFIVLVRSRISKSQNEPARGSDRTVRRCHADQRAQQWLRPAAEHRPGQPTQQRACARACVIGRAIGAAAVAGHAVDGTAAVAFVEFNGGTERIPATTAASNPATNTESAAATDNDAEGGGTDPSA